MVCVALSLYKKTSGTFRRGVIHSNPFYLGISFRSHSGFIILLVWIIKYFI